MKPNKMTSMEALKQRAYELAESPGSTAGEREAIALLLRRCERQGLNGGQTGRGKHQWDAATASFEKRDKLEEVYENPLDDDEKLRAVRIAVFGSAPE
jgi:hypothetical protein